MTGGRAAAQAYCRTGTTVVGAIENHTNNAFMQEQIIKFAKTRMAGCSAERAFRERHERILRVQSSTPQKKVLNKGNNKKGRVVQ